MELAARPRGSRRKRELPEPICPSGVVSSRVEEGFEEPPAPGASPLDEGLEEMRRSLGDEEGGDA